MATYLDNFILVRFLFPAFLSLLLLTCSLSSRQSLCHEDESSALLRFKDGFLIMNESFCTEYYYKEAYPKLASWSLEREDNDCCSWDGVECDEYTGHIISLDLSGSCLFGSINSNSSLFRLLQLQRLNLAFNDFNSSQIPYGVGNLSRLTYLNLSDANFFGQIPSEISLHSRLSVLDLSFNSDLYSTIGLESFVHNLTGLEELLLCYADISSPVPESLANFSSLKNLGLAGCGFYGKFPSKIFQLPRLEQLSLYYNRNLTGQLDEFPLSSPLKTLDLSYCNFSGYIPNSLSNLTKLLYLDLSGTLFTDVSWLYRAHSNVTQSKIEHLGLDSLGIRKFPNILLNQNKLAVLWLSGNNLRGLIPGWMYNVSKDALRIVDFSNNFLTGFEHSPIVLPWDNLEELFLYNNMLQGLFPVPSPSLQKLYISKNFLSGFQQPLETLQQSNLEYFIAENNRLQGLLPIPPPSIRYYQVRHNALTGGISQTFCKRSSLKVLDLSNNNLSGMLHPCLGYLSQSLVVLGLRSNNFDSTIPNTWPKDCNLRMIDLSQNQLEGQMPTSLANCGTLEYLNVGSNQINDTFPFWLKNISQLKILILHFNGFHGATSNVENNTTMLELHILDLSNNNFSGNLPARNLLQSNAMKIIGANQLQYMRSEGGVGVDYSVTITNKGIVLEYKKINIDLTVIDLSCNRFEGGIPKLLGNLKGLRVLNLSNNALTGPIPMSLRNLTQLESLDLSHNMFFGEIPRQLTQLSWLVVFNVSYNDFTGTIPHGNQFDTFENTSFEGNPELCGRPLSKMCENSKHSPISPSSFENDQGSQSLLNFGWKIVVIGYGCGFIVGVIIGQIVIAKEPNWFIKTFGKKQQSRRRRVNRWK